ncbi:cytochrome c peroxidase [Catalinimonas alkaloidigena]|uniref:Cytochrome c peroxidase n=1 Tax=Catalinimonas alkaloidigena TaxID=1075417 RepID=A0A1G8WAP7_9BACT|nr:cytochrome c peroxidase [Catalinimonas alkaloidigena]SDJ75147.1 cytochrome c peroxidase [Catalinimonas alkaloidigena]
MVRSLLPAVRWTTFFRRNSFRVVAGACLLVGVLSSCRETATPEEEPLPEAKPVELTLPPYFSRKNIFDNPANPLTDQGIALGRMLFYDTRLSADGTVACATCHQQEHAFADTEARAVGIGGQVGRRSSMSLANLLWVNRLFWDGRVATLEEQALHPIQDPLEMGSTPEELARKLQGLDDYPRRFQIAFGTDQISPDLITRALAQFQRTLISADSKYDRYLRGEAQLTEQEERGLLLFQTHPEPTIGLRGGNCGDCHVGVTFGGDATEFRGFFNNGITTGFTSAADLGREAQTGDSLDRGRFRAPSLRNIALTAPYMHDGRFQTLEEVLDHYNQPDLFGRPNVDLLIRQGTNDPYADGRTPGRSLMLTDQEKADIVAFLHTLTDTTFIHNPDFADPSQSE